MPSLALGSTEYMYKLNLLSIPSAPITRLITEESTLAWLVPYVTSCGQKRSAFCINQVARARIPTLAQENSGISTLRRKRRRHPSLLKTPSGVEEIIPGLSSWTVEDLLEAGAWDEELAELADQDDEDVPGEPDPDR